MPIFEFDCESCGEGFDLLIRNDSDPRACKACGSTKIKKKLSAPAFQLKGTGWYATDFGGKSSSQDRKSEFEPPTKIPEHMEKDFRMNDKSVKEDLKRKGIKKNVS